MCFIKTASFNDLEAFTKNGAIALSVKADYQESIYRGTEGIWARSKADQVNEIVLDALKVALASPDLELSNMASLILEYFLEQNQIKDSFYQDPLILVREQMGLALIDAIIHVSEGSNLAVFEVYGTEIFRDPAVGEQLRRFAEIQMEIVQKRNDPELIQAYYKYREAMQSDLYGENYLLNVDSMIAYEKLKLDIDELVLYT